MRKIFLPLVLAGLLAAPWPAAAFHEGNSGIDQYEEAVPGVGGNRPANGGGNGSQGSGDGSLLSQEDRNALEARGALGAAAADLAAATAGADRSAAGGGASAGGDRGDAVSGSGGSEGGGGSTPDGGSGLLDAIPSPVLGGQGADGMGIVFPIILAAAGVAFLLLIARRLRMKGEGGPPA